MSELHKIVIDAWEKVNDGKKAKTHSIVPRTVIIEIPKDWELHNCRMVQELNCVGRVRAGPRETFGIIATPPIIRKNEMPTEHNCQKEDHLTEWISKISYRQYKYSRIMNESQPDYTLTKVSIAAFVSKGDNDPDWKWTVVVDQDHPEGGILEEGIASTERAACTLAKALVEDCYERNEWRK